MNRLKELRLEAGESQEYVGTLIGVSGQAIGQYESEKRDLSPDKILKLSEHYNCSTDYLLGKSEIRNPEKVDIDDINVAFSSGIKGLNDTNKAIIKSTIEALLAKQEKDEEDKKNKK